MLRTATLADVPAIDALMKASTAAIFPASYDERQTSRVMCRPTSTFCRMSCAGIARGWCDGGRRPIRRG